MADIEGSNGQRTEFKAVGRANLPGRLSYTIATGRAKYGIDAVVPGMLHAKFLRSPYGRARIKGMDVSKAKALEGVVDIVTWDDPEVLSINPGLTNPPVHTMAGIHAPLIPNEAETEDEEIGAVVVAVIDRRGVGCAAIHCGRPGWAETRRADHPARPERPGIEFHCGGY
jgi:xanthine dehydrogenase molybdopterin-binding subunit B